MAERSRVEFSEHTDHLPIDLRQLQLSREMNELGPAPLDLKGWQIRDGDVVFPAGLLEATRSSWEPSHASETASVKVARYYGFGGNQLDDVDPLTLEFQ